MSAHRSLAHFDDEALVGELLRRYEIRKAELERVPEPHNEYFVARPGQATTEVRRSGWQTWTATCGCGIQGSAKGLISLALADLFPHQALEHQQPAQRSFGLRRRRRINTWEAA